MTTGKMYWKDSVSKKNPSNSKYPSRLQSLIDTTDQLQSYACMVPRSAAVDAGSIFHFTATADRFRYLQNRSNILLYTQILQVFSLKHDSIFQRHHSSKG